MARTSATTAWTATPAHAAPLSWSQYRKAPGSNVIPLCYDHRMMMTEIEMPEFVCCYCDEEVPDGKACYPCGEYKGVMRLADWEEYTNLKW